MFNLNSHKKLTKNVSSYLHSYGNGESERSSNLPNVRQQVGSKNGVYSLIFFQSLFLLLKNAASNIMKWLLAQYHSSSENKTILDSL